jgi:integrase/recombinase XerD
LDVARLLTAVYDDLNQERGIHDWVLLAFLYGSGLRLGEALALTFDQISPREGHCHR